jgi:hypothetical protein
MRKLTLALAMLALLPTLAAAQSTYPQKRATLAYAWDLDGEAADDDQIVAAATLADSATFTIAAQPDVCRLIDMTVVDADSSITAGMVTIAGTDCLNYARTCVFNFNVVATRGSGVKTIPVTVGSGSSCYLSAVASVGTGLLTGEGGAGDTLKVGYTSNSAVGWSALGAMRGLPTTPEHGVDPLGYQAAAPGLLTTTGSSTAVENSEALGFDTVSVGDLIQFDTQGVSYDRIVTAKADGNSITVNVAVDIPTGVAWAHKKYFFSTDPSDVVAIDVRGYRTLLIDWDVAANANTGGVQMILQGAVPGPGWPSSGWVTLCPTAGVDCSGVTQSVASGATKSATSEWVDLTKLPYHYIRLGWKFGTGDDTDTAPESISATIVLQ